MKRFGLSVFAVILWILPANGFGGDLGNYFRQHEQNEARQTISEMDRYYLDYADGVLQEAPAVLAETVKCFGCKSIPVAKLLWAIMVVGGAAAGLEASISAGIPVQPARIHLQDAIESGNQVFGNVQEAIHDYLEKHAT